MAEPADLTPREWELVNAIRDRKTTTQIAEEWDISRPGVDLVRDRLMKKGVVYRVGEIPLWMSHAVEYPFRVDDRRDVRYKPAVPPDAKFRALWPTDSKNDLSVTPIRVVRWPRDNEDVGGWVVEGLPTVDPEGRSPARLVPDRRVVWCLGSIQAGGKEAVDVAFSVSVKHPWAESHTQAAFRKFRVELSRPNLEGLTLMIAAVVAVNPVLDITATVTGGEK